MTIPNFITILRLLLVPAIVLLLLERQFAFAFVVFALAGASDAVDGLIARLVPSQASTLGAYLDPLADKALLVSIYVTLGIIGEIPAWLVVLVVSRDLLILAAVVLSWMMAHPVRIDPLKISKANTLAQILFATLALADLGLHFRLEGLLNTLMWAVAGLTIASALAYGMGWIKHMTGS